jgi:hypothetical protein
MAGLALAEVCCADHDEARQSPCMFMQSGIASEIISAALDYFR